MSISAQKHIGRRLALILAIAAVSISSIIETPARAEQDLSFSAPGPFAVKIFLAELDVAALDAPLPLRIAVPDGQGPYPVIVFSHGAFCANDEYTAVTDHWVSYGNVVIAANHPDARPFGRVDFQKMGQIFRTRIGQMRLIPELLEDIEAQDSALAGRLDPGRIVAAGHSMGAAVAMAVTGIAIRDDPNKGTQFNFSDPRFRATLLLSGPGPSPEYADESWAVYDVPTFLSTGTKDLTGTNRRLGVGWEWRLGSFTQTAPGNKYALVIDNMDHFLGGHYCPQSVKELALDDDALAYVKAASVAFLGAQLKEDKTAAEALENWQTSFKAAGSRAELRAR